MENRKSFTEPDGVSCRSAVDIHLRALQEPAIVAIVFDGRSGSVFLQSLLDNHEEVLSTPATVLRNYYHLWAGTRSSDPCSLADWFCATFPTLFDSREDETQCRLNQLGRNRNEFIRVERDLFKKYLVQILEGEVITRRSFFIAAHFAYAMAKGQDISSKKLLVYALHMPHHTASVQAFVEDFPSAKVLFTTRHPLATHASHYRHHLERQQVELGIRDPYDVLISIFDHAFRGAETMAHFVPRSQIRAVRLEDIHLQSQQIMEKIARWLGIHFHPGLLESTFDGKLWWGLMSSPMVNGFSEYVLSRRWQREYYRMDMRILEFLFADRYRHYGYEPLYAKSKVRRSFMPFAMLFLLRWEIEGLGHLFSIEVHRASLRRLWNYYRYRIPPRTLPFNLFRFRAVAWALRLGRIGTTHLRFLCRYLRYVRLTRWRMFFAYYRKVLSDNTVTFDLI